MKHNLVLGANICVIAICFTLGFIIPALVYHPLCAICLISVTVKLYLFVRSDFNRFQKTLMRQGINNYILVIFWILERL